MNRTNIKFSFFIAVSFGIIVCFSPSIVSADFAGGASASAIAKIDGTTTAIIAEETVIDNGSYGDDIFNTDHALYNDGVTDHLYIAVTGQDGVNDIVVKHFEWSDGLVDFSLIDTYTDAGFEGESKAITVDPNTGNVYVTHLEFVNFAPDYYTIKLPADLSALSDSISYDSGQDDTPRGIFFDASTNELLVVGDNPSGMVNINYTNGFPSSAPYLQTVGRIPYTGLSSMATVDNGAGNIEYQLSPDGNTFYYHNGATWVSQSGLGYPSQTNTAAEINSNIATFSGPGDLTVRIFLKSDGSTDPQLDEMSFVYGAAVSPTGSQTTDRDVAVYQQRWFPKAVLPISVRPVLGTSDCLLFTFSNPSAADDNPYNDPDKYTLTDARGILIGDSGIDAAPKTSVFSIQSCGWQPNQCINGIKAFASNGSGRSAASSVFPEGCTLPEIPIFEVIPYIKIITETK